MHGLQSHTTTMTVEELKTTFQHDFGDSLDLILLPDVALGHPALYVYLAGLSDRNLLEQGILWPLAAAAEAEVNADTIRAVAHSSAPCTPLEDLSAAEAKVAEGEVVLWVEDAFFSFLLPQFDKRSPQEPPTSAVLKGPREGFGEDVGQNITLLRRRLKDKSLVVRKMQVGTLTKTTVAVCFLSTVAKPQVVDEVVRRIGAIQIDGVVDSAYVGQLIADNPYSIFSQFSTAEKPDIVTAKMLEGRVAVVVDGSPMVITLPCLLLEGFQDSEDYYRGNKRTTFLRVIRLVGVVMAVLLPAGYVAVQEYHYQVLPLKFLVTVINATNGVPFSPTIEMFVVLVLFEILNEASVRMPKYVGMALSIVGAIVLGETAVNAGLLSSPAVLVMALSAIGLYTTPEHIGSLGLLRFVFLVMAGLFGFVGLMVSTVITVCYVVTLSNYGVAYAAPLAPLVPADLKDSLVKLPLDHMVTRPYSIPTINRRRFRKEKKQ